MQKSLSFDKNAGKSHWYWLTWIIPFFACYAGTIISHYFRFSDGAAMIYLPVPLAMAMIQWWGPRVLCGVCINAFAFSGLPGLESVGLRICNALSEFIAVWLTWFIFTKHFKGNQALSNISDLMHYLILAIIPASCIIGFALPALLFLAGEIPGSSYTIVSLNEFSMTMLGCFSITIPLLILLSEKLQKSGFANEINAHCAVLYFQKIHSLPEAVEIFLLFTIPLLVCLQFKIQDFWYIYIIFGLWSAIRYGLGITIILDMWIAALTIASQFIFNSMQLFELPAGYESVNFHIGLGLVCGASVIIGSTVTTLRREVLAHRNTLNELIKEKEFTDTVLQTIADAFVLFDPVSLEPIRWNRAFCKISGYDDCELNNPQVLSMLMNKDEYENLFETVQMLIIDKSAKVEVNFRSKNGVVIPVEFQLTLSFDKMNNPEYLIAIGRDISDRRIAEAKLKESEVQYRTTFHFSRDAIYVYKENLEIIDVNNRMIELSGYSQHQLIGMSVSELYLSSGGEDVNSRMPALLNDETVPIFESEMITKSGKTVPVEIGVSSMRDCYGEKIVFMCVVRNVTDRKKTDEMVRNSHKLESLGILAGGIAHDFNNLMGGVFGNIELARESIDNRSSAILYIDRSLKALERTKELTQKLLTFSKGQVPVKRVVSLETLIDEASTLALRGSNIRCVTQISRNLHDVNADPEQIGQVLNNLLVNARQSMNKEGTVTITARNTEVVENEIKELIDGKYVSIEIHDEGHGIPHSIINKVFDPFFTARKTGYGLGLATCHSIIKKHNGIISVESVPEKGTTFRILLPAIAIKISEPGSDEC